MDAAPLMHQWTWLPRQRGANAMEMDPAVCWGIPFVRVYSDCSSSLDGAWRTNCARAQTRG